MINTEYYSHGKLLLTGEYVVLDGAKALALPCKFGQSLQVRKSNDHKYSWISYLKNGEVWQKTAFSLDDILQSRFSTDFEKRLFQILKIVYNSKPELFSHAYNFSTRLEFEKHWGFGSSSTLINNVSQWAGIDPYKLLDHTFGGSGYDVAAASMTTPFFYKRFEGKVTTNVTSLPDILKPHLFFIYLNQKQNSRKAIKNYREINKSKNEEAIKRISEITEKVSDVTDLSSFENLLKEHESIIAKLIGIKPVQELKFKDYKNGIVKSLGAWGGDFIMVSARHENDLNYFSNKGYKTILGFDDIIL